MCEAIFELFGTSSKEIAANATKEAEIKIHDLTLKVTSLSNENISLSSENTSLSNEVSQLRALLAEHNIPIP